MTNRFFPALSVAAVILFSAAIFRPDSGMKMSASQQAGKIYQDEMRRLDSMLVAYPRYFLDSNYNARIRVYTDLARQFKRVELFFLYFYPEKAYTSIWQPIQSTKQPTGPSLPDNFLIAGPFGIDADSVVAKTSKANRDFERMFITRAANKFRATMAETQYEKSIPLITDSQIMEALKLQLFNISSVGLGNGDFQLNPINLPCIQAEMQIWSKVMKVYLAQLPKSSKKLKIQVEDLLDETEKYFTTHTDFDTFDRMELLTQYLNPISAHLATVRKTLKIPASTRFAALNPEASGLFEADIFNVSFFMPDSNTALFKERSELGKVLFFDPILSDNNERTLISLNSRFDKYMRGEKTALNTREINGFNIFMGKGRCGSCHYPPLFNGTLPPHFAISDHRSLGVPVKDTMSKYELDADIGLQHSSRNPLFKASFKIPTVRNAALTAPYMHNGIYQTLDQVVEFYNHGAGNKFSFRGVFLSILPDSLNLSTAEKKDLISFVHALTDTSGTSMRPRYLPEIKGRHAALNDRIIGGKF
jgi:hypothetical protein